MKAWAHEKLAVTTPQRRKKKRRKMCNLFLLSVIFLITHNSSKCLHTWTTSTYVYEVPGFSLAVVPRLRGRIFSGLTECLNFVQFVLIFAGSSRPSLS